MKVTSKRPPHSTADAHNGSIEASKPNWEGLPLDAALETSMYARTPRLERLGDKGLSLRHLYPCAAGSIPLFRVS